MITQKQVFAGAMAFSLTFSPLFATASSGDKNWKPQRPLILSIDAPVGADRPRTFGPFFRGGFRAPTLFTDGWTLTFRMAAPASVGSARLRLRLSESSADYDVLVLSDTDDCFDLSQAYPTEFFPNQPPAAPLEQDCTAGQDEDTITYVPDTSEEPGVRDSSQICSGFGSVFSNNANPALRARLTDDPFNASDPNAFLTSNVSYIDRDPLDGDSTTVDLIGPDTGGVDDGSSAPGAGDVFDCFGFGADEDVPGLVVMANVGASRIFSPTRDYANDRIRNLAGFTSAVSFDFLDSGGASSIVAQMPIRPNMLQKFTYIDLSQPINFFDNPDPIVIKRQIEDGPIETVANLPAGVSGADARNALFDALADDYVVTIRAVFVEGVAPDIVTDEDGDGRFTARDVEMMGYTLLSNQAVQRVRLTNFRQDVADNFRGFLRCPFTAPIFVDLDGDGQSFGCEDFSDGTSASGRRVPR
ncbi:MAG: hypothetical protein AAF668_06390 [Pseudomonadota bacterium]